MSKSNLGAVREYQEFYSDECINILSKHLRREMNQRGADVRGLRQQWKEYMELRRESIEYLKSIGEWGASGLPVERDRRLSVDED